MERLIAHNVQAVGTAHMREERPNIVLFMTDQHRGDCLGIEGHPVLQTPYLDHIAASGVRFRQAYSACPVCVPARRTLMTGQKPRAHGVLTNYDTWLAGPTLPGELARAGYQTHLVGKLHLWPQRKLYGFMSADWADGPVEPPGSGDYGRFLEQELGPLPDGGAAHGAHPNGWLAHPWHLDEHLHFSDWCAQRALEFLRRRDPTVPFFLKVSFHAPHQPCTPPPFYFQRYMAMELPEPYVGDWARVFDGPRRGLAPSSPRVALEPAVMKQYRAGYYGCVNHIDTQIGRVLRCLPANTVVAFVSDHGEMLGDHQWIRKSVPFQPSVRVPLLLRFPRPLGMAPAQVRDEPVELMDLMPTLLEAAGAPVPPTVDGKSLLPLLRGQSVQWRPYLHGECAEVTGCDTGQQYLTDGKRKFIWYPHTGQEQYFDLQADPREMIDLAGDPARQDELHRWRQRLVQELNDRPEGFVKDGRLVRLDGPPHLCVPGRQPASPAPSRA